jgi:putative oxidoreductase
MHYALDAFYAAQRFAARIAAAFHWLPPLLARFVVGWIFFQSGWGKLHNLGQVTDYFTELGLPAPAAQATFASGTEFVCGALLLAGLATRYAAVPLIIIMLVALRTALWDQIDSLGALFGIAEFLYIALLVAIATYGAGPLSLDHVLERLRGREKKPAAAAMLAARSL